MWRALCPAGIRDARRPMPCGHTVGHHGVYTHRVLSYRFGAVTFIGEYL